MIHDFAVQGVGALARCQIRGRSKQCVGIPLGSLGARKLLAKGQVCDGEGGLLTEIAKPGQVAGRRIFWRIPSDDQKPDARLWGIQGDRPDNSQLQLGYQGMLDGFPDGSANAGRHDLQDGTVRQRNGAQRLASQLAQDRFRPGFPCRQDYRGQGRALKQVAHSGNQIIADAFYTRPANGEPTWPVLVRGCCFWPADR